MSFRNLCLSSKGLTPKFTHCNSRRFYSIQSTSLNNITDSSVKNSTTKDGSVEGIWIFHRHGDRTPSCPLCAEGFRENEASFWRTKLPDTAVVEDVAHRFPKLTHSSDDVEYLDGKKFPYGFLTRVGASQMYNAGRSFAVRYNRLMGKNLKSSDVGPDIHDLLTYWDITAYSTNYLRTITSAQFFLEGLLNSENHMTLNPSNNIIHVNVRRRDIDTLNAFDKNPEKMLALVSDVVSSKEFQERDSRALPLATLLTKFLPGLSTKRKGFFGGPSGINWIHANDHFICRAAHGLKLSTVEPVGSSDANKPDVSPHNDKTNFDETKAEESMQALAHPTMTHLVWRFRQWFTNSPLLSAIVVPPLREVEMELRKTACLSQSNKKRPLKIFSCHDVTILSLLYGLDASKIHDDEKYWPPYATTLVFELVKITETNDFVVRVLLNGEQIKMKKQDSKFMRIDDFSNLIDDLEIAGGLKNDEENTDSDSMERDISGWTG